jgi:predicted glutamine amidotransferase
MQRQAIRAEEMSTPINGDGCGVSWYDFRIDSEPGQFRSIHPSWSNTNLRLLCQKIKTSLLFAHVRAASPGAIIDQLNCHPFVYGQLSWMHNGMVGGFKSIRRSLLSGLNDESYEVIRGSTDSEYMFGLFLNKLKNPKGDVSTDEMIIALSDMYNDLKKLLLEKKIEEHSYINICVTNGKSIIATRYTTNPRVQPASLYYVYGKEYIVDENEKSYMIPDTGKAGSVIIASEPFTENKSDWMRVERNSMMIVDENLNISFKQLN